MRSLAEIVPPGESTRTMMPLTAAILPGGFDLARDLLGLAAIDDATDVDHDDPAISGTFAQDGPIRPRLRP